MKPFIFLLITIFFISCKSSQIQPGKEIDEYVNYHDFDSIPYPRMELTTCKLGWIKYNQCTLISVTPFIPLPDSFIGKAVVFNYDSCGNMIDDSWHLIDEDSVEKYYNSLPDYDCRRDSI